METELLKARIYDIADICEKNNRPKFMGFLSLEEASLAEKLLSKRNIMYKLWGGYDDAQRRSLGCFPDWCEETHFPIKAITFNYRKANKLSHRDFLGSLMALGIKRETVGDILIEDGRAVAFVSEEIAEYIIQEVKKVGRIGVEPLIGFTLPLPQIGTLAEFSETVASLRLDCVVSALTNVSRARACEKIVEGTVSVNSERTEKTTRIICDGDVLTVRGSGKFIILSTFDRSRKGRIILKYKKYI